MRGRPAFAAGLAVAALLLLVSFCSAQFPMQMNYQVMLTDDADQPLANESVQFVFRLYDQEAGGSELWTETQNVTTNSIGVVSVAMGSVNPLAFFTFEPLWLEVEVEGEVMTPRRQLLEAPYAKVAWEADHAFNADNLDELPGEDYALYVTLSNPGSINNPTNPLEWTRLKNVPAGFADGVDDAGEGDGHSLDASDGSPTDVVRVDAEGRTGIGSTTTTDPYCDYSLYVGGASSRGGILAETDCVSPFAAGVLAGASVYSAVLGCAYETPGELAALDCPTGVTGSVEGTGVGGAFIGLDDGTAVYCSGWGTGDVVLAHSAGTGYSGRFEGGNGVLIQRYSSIPAFKVENLATSGWGDAAYFSSGPELYSSTWTLNSVCSEGTAGRFAKAVDDDVYAVSISGASSLSEGLHVSGTIVSTGLMARVVETSRGAKPVFGVAAPDVELMVSGRGRLTDGFARIDFDGVFAESITGPADLRVTATPVGQWSAIYVERKDEGGFDLRSDAGDKNAEFDWVAVGRARGHAERPQVTIPDPDEEARVAAAKAAEIEARRPSRREPPKVIRGTMP